MELRLSTTIVYFDLRGIASCCIEAAMAGTEAK